MLRSVLLSSCLALLAPLALVQHNGVAASSSGSTDSGATITSTLTSTDLATTTTQTVYPTTFTDPAVPLNMVNFVVCYHGCSQILVNGTTVQVLPTDVSVPPNNQVLPTAVSMPAPVSNTGCINCVSSLPVVTIPSQICTTLVACGYAYPGCNDQVVGNGYAELLNFLNGVASSTQSVSYQTVMSTSTGYSTIVGQAMQALEANDAPAKKNSPYLSLAMFVIAAGFLLA